MLPLMRVALVVTSTAMFFLPATDVWAKGGRGGGGGFKGGGRGGESFKGGGFKAAPGRPGRGGAKPGRGGFNRVQHASGWRHAAKNNAPTRYSGGAGESWGKHYAREQRKLDHRRRVADHLRDISDMNGNDQLRRAADDMDRRAEDHFDRQIQKINDRYGLEGGLAGDEFGNLTNDPLSGDGILDNDNGLVDDSLEDVARKLTGRENALYRRLRNEQRKLAQRMDAVERMRQFGQQSGDQGMLEAADRLEQWAMDHFDQRMTQITDFQQRHGLPDVDNHLAR